MRLVLITICVVLNAGCASCPDNKGEAPWYRGTVPTEVVARVDSFRGIGAFFDYANAFEVYHSVVLVTEGPDAVGWKRISLQYQGVPMLNGQRLELGQRIRFTVPPSKTNECCGPYLKEIADAVLLGPR